MKNNVNFKETCEFNFQHVGLETTSGHRTPSIKLISERWREVGQTNQFQSHIHGAMSAIEAFLLGEMGKMTKIEN